MIFSKTLELSQGTANSLMCFLFMYLIYLCIAKMSTTDPISWLTNTVLTTYVFLFAVIYPIIYCTVQYNYMYHGKCCDIGTVNAAYAALIIYIFTTVFLSVITCQIFLFIINLAYCIFIVVPCFVLFVCSSFPGKSAMTRGFPAEIVHNLGSAATSYTNNCIIYGIPRAFTSICHYFVFVCHHI